MWTQPKTDWTGDDYFNAVDFNRMKNNLVYLRELACQLYKEFAIQSVGSDKTYRDYFYADEINRLENNLTVINDHTLHIPYGETPVYYDNGNTMTYEELNRLERAMLDLFSKLTNQSNGRRNLVFHFEMRGGL